MEQKLKLIFREPRSTLALKSVIFGGFLFLLKLGGFGFLPTLFFLGMAFVLSSQAHHTSFLILIIISMLTVWHLDSVLFLLLAIIFFSIIFYLTVGVKKLLIVHRFEWGFVKNLLLLFSVFLLFFLSDKSSFFWIKYLSVFLASFLLLREWLQTPELSFFKRPQLVSWTLAFVLLEFLWVVALLPLSPINAASLMALVFYTLFDFLRNHFQGTVTRQLVVKRITIFALLLVLIFGTSGWEIG